MVNVFPVPKGPSKRTGGEEVLVSDNAIAATACFCSWLNNLSRNKLERIRRLPASTCRTLCIIWLSISRCLSFRNTKSMCSRLSTAKCHSQKLRRLNTNCIFTLSSFCSFKFQKVTHSLLNLTNIDCEHLSSIWASKIIFEFSRFSSHSLIRTLLQLRCRSLPLCVSSKMSRVIGSCGGNKFHALAIIGGEKHGGFLFDLTREEVNICVIKEGGGAKKLYSQIIREVWKLMYKNMRSQRDERQTFCARGMMYERKDWKMVERKKWKKKKKKKMF